MHWIEVSVKPGFSDALGNSTLAAISEDLQVKGVKSVSYVDVYYISAEIPGKELEGVAKNVLADPITQEYAIDRAVRPEFNWEITVRYNPDVTDNVGATAKQAIEDFLGKEIGGRGCVRTARKYALRGAVSESDVKRICRQLMANEVIETFECKKGK